MIDFRASGELIAAFNTQQVSEDGRRLFVVLVYREEAVQPYAVAMYVELDKAWASGVYSKSLQVAWERFHSKAQEWLW